MLNGLKPAAHAVSDEMSAHPFTYAGLTYEVRFHRMDGQWLATLYMHGSNHGRSLRAAADDVLTTSKDRMTIRAGYVAVAKWLVQTGQWPDREIRSNSGPVWAA
jgi:hypothetical protein